MAKRALTFSDGKTPKKPRQDSPPPGDIHSTSTNATVYAMIASVSPLRPSSYFDGEITDGDKMVRIVGFDKAHSKQLRTFCDEKVPITLHHCRIQQNKFSNKFEVVLKPNTKIEQSSV